MSNIQSSCLIDHVICYDARLKLTKTGNTRSPKALFLNNREKEFVSFVENFSMGVYAFLIYILINLYAWLEDKTQTRLELLAQSNLVYTMRCII